MRRLRSFIITSLLGSLAVGGCDCGEDPAGGGDTGGGADLGFDDSGRPIQPDGSLPDLGFDDSGRPIQPDASRPDLGFDGDGNAIMADVNPLEVPLSDFCNGTGTAVVVGAGGVCAGQVAQDTFKFGLCACEDVAVQSNLLIDAFDSSRGPYGSGNVLDDGHLGVNADLQLSRKLTVRGGAYVGGAGFSVGPESEVTQNVYAAGPATQANSQSSIGRNAYFDGNVSGRISVAGDLFVPAGATIEFPNLISGAIQRATIPHLLPCPCAPADILDVAALTEYGRTNNDNDVEHVLTSTTWQDGTGTSSITLPCGRYYVTRITAQQLYIRAEGRTVLFVDGDMRIDGGLTIELAPGAEIDLFIKGSLTVGAAARLGSQAQPSAVRTYVGGTDTIAMSASSVFGGNVYAPRSDVVFVASANLYGSLFAKSVDFGGSAEIHFDSSIRTAGQECVPPAVDGGAPDATGGPADASVLDGPMTPTGDAQLSDGALVNPDATAPDASAPDAGPEGCTSVCSPECGTLACIIPDGQTSGMCTTCRTDLDCCAPLSCIDGVCQLNL
ncbi:MAG: hypothetical protein HYV07_11675 [Deltaproteobacteria bacterium]|nr:hypothetical protein [Deltaproteobacteria bacterium]